MTASTIDRKPADRRPGEPAAQLALLGLREPPAIAEHRVKVATLKAEIDQHRAAQAALVVTVDAASAHANVISASRDSKAVATAREAVRTAKRERDDHNAAVEKLTDELTQFRLVEIRDHDQDVRELDIRRRHVEALEILAPLGKSLFAMGEELRVGIAAAHAVTPASAPQLMRDVAHRVKPGTSIGAYNVEQLPDLLVAARRALAEDIATYRRKWGV